MLRLDFGFSRPGAGKKNRGKLGPKTVRFKRNSEQTDCSEIAVDSQGETDGPE
jgi:hypothetical protein